MVTINQKQAFNLIAEKVKKGEKISIGEIMRAVGYSLSTSLHPNKLTKAKGFQQLLAQIDDEVILARFYGILLDDDKRASMDAGKELLKLKDRYPAGKINISDTTDQAKYWNKIKELTGRKKKNKNRNKRNKRKEKEL